MIKRLRWKLVGINMALALAMLAVIFVLVYQFTAADLQKTEEAALKTAAMTKPRPDAPGNLGGTIPCFTLRLTGPGFLVAAGSDAYDLSDMDALWQLYNRALETGEKTGTLRQYGLRFYRSDGPEGIVVAFTDTAYTDSTLQGLLQTFAWIGAVSILGFFGISVLLARWAVRPVAKSWAQQQQFVADASHELKTPLTVILTNAELLQQAEYSPEEKGRFAENILTMSRQMRHLVENLLQLARADNGQTQAAQSCLDLSSLVENALLPFEPAYFEQGLMLDSRIAPDIRVLGCRQQLQQVVDILLDNGLKYAAPGSQVVLSLDHSGRGKCLLTVFTPGQPLSEAACRDIFKRFYRLDEARTDRSSYGLGLSIAQGIVQQHKGQIWAQGFPAGNAFYVSLPQLGKTGN